MDKNRKMMLMSMTEEEIWRGERDSEASQTLLDLQRQAVPEAKERTPFLVVWGRKKRLVSRTRRVSGGLNSTTLATLFTSPTTALSNGPPSSVSEDSYNHQNHHQSKNKSRKPLGESAVEKPTPNINNGFDFCQLYPLTSQAKNKRRKLLGELAQTQQKQQSTSLYTRDLGKLIDGTKNMAFSGSSPNNKLPNSQSSRRLVHQENA